MNFTLKNVIFYNIVWLLTIAVIIWERSIILASIFSTIINFLLFLTAFYGLTHVYRFLKNKHGILSTAFGMSIAVLGIVYLTHIIVYGFYAIRELLATV